MLIIRLIQLFLLSYAKIMQMSAMKTCFQIAECSLSYAKKDTTKSQESVKNEVKSFCHS